MCDLCSVTIPILSLLGISMGAGQSGLSHAANHMRSRCLCTLWSQWCAATIISTVLPGHVGMVLLTMRNLHSSSFLRYSPQGHKPEDRWLWISAGRSVLILVILQPGGGDSRIYGSTRMSATRLHKRCTRLVGSRSTRETRCTWDHLGGFY